MKTIIEFIQKGFYYMWKADLAIFIILIIGILMLFIVSWIYGIIRKNIHKDKESKNP
jgi:hypothetical protein